MHQCTRRDWDQTNIQFTNGDVKREIGNTLVRSPREPLHRVIDSCYREVGWIVLFYGWGDCMQYKLVAPSPVYQMPPHDDDPPPPPSEYFDERI